MKLRRAHVSPVIIGPITSTKHRREAERWDRITGAEKQKRRTRRRRHLAIFRWLRLGVDFESSGTAGGRKRDAIANNNTLFPMWQPSLIYDAKFSKSWRLKMIPESRKTPQQCRMVLVITAAFTRFQTLQYYCNASIKNSFIVVKFSARTTKQQVIFFPWMSLLPTTS